MKLGIALSGGGIKGIAHAGVLQALHEYNLKVDIIGGTSSGGIIASLYAMGYNPKQILDLYKTNVDGITSFKTNPLISGLTNFLGKKKGKFIGFKTGQSLEQSYIDLAKNNNINNISDIKMPLVIPAVDLSDSREYIFTNYLPKEKTKNVQYITDIPIGKAVRATSSFPAIFCPCNYKTHRFLDGGVLDNIPVVEVKNQGASKVVAVRFEPDGIDETSNLMDIAMHTIDIMGSQISKNNLDASDLILTIKTDKMGFLDTSKIDECFNYGYEAAIKNINKIKSLFI